MSSPRHQKANISISAWNLQFVHLKLTMWTGCLEQRVSQGNSWVMPFSSSEHLYSLERCWAESAPLCNSVEQCHSQNHLGTLSLCLPDPFCRFFDRKHGKQCKPSLKMWGVTRLKPCWKYKWMQTEVPERGHPKLCCLDGPLCRGHPIIVT